MRTKTGPGHRQGAIPARRAPGPPSGASWRGQPWRRPGDRLPPPQGASASAKRKVGWARASGQRAAIAPVTGPVPVDRSTLSEENKDTADEARCSSLSRTRSTQPLRAVAHLHTYECPRVSLHETHGIKGKPGAHLRCRCRGRWTRGQSLAFWETPAAVMTSPWATLSCLHGGVHVRVRMRQCWSSSGHSYGFLVTFSFSYLKALLEFLYKIFFNLLPEQNNKAILLWGKQPYRR